MRGVIEIIVPPQTALHHYVSRVSAELYLDAAKPLAVRPKGLAGALCHEIKSNITLVAARIIEVSIPRCEIHLYDFLATIARM